MAIMLPIVQTVRRWSSAIRRNCDFLALFESNLAGKPTIKIGHWSTAATHCSSKADNDEAFMAGQAAVRAAVLDAGSIRWLSLVVRRIPMNEIDWHPSPKSPMG